MTEKFRIVKLSKVLTHQKEFHIIDDTETYKRCRVQLHAKGIVLRDEIEGYRIKTKKQQFCQTGEFLVAEIDAKVGGFGIVPPELDGAIVSSHYFLFTIDEEQLDRRFLNYYIRTLDFREQVNARGSTNYAAIRPHHVLDMTIPLPLLPEQRRIVVKIEELTAKVEEAKRMRRKAIEEAEKVIQNSFYTITNVYHIVNFKETIEKLDFHIGKIKKRDFKVNGQYPVIDQGQLFIAGYSDKQKSLYNGPLPVVIFGDHTKTVKFVDFRFIQGADGIRILLPQKDVVVPKYLYYCIKFIDLEDRGYNRHYKVLKESKIPLPNHEKQRYIVAYLDNLQAKIDSLKRLQLETQYELDALIPSTLAKAFRGGEL